MLHMTISPSPTRKHIIDVAAKLFYAEGIGRVSVDAVAEKAGVTKRTLYYHFTSKDELVAAYLLAQDQPSLKQLSAWYEACEDEVEDKVEAVFKRLAIAARHPKWRGCGFMRTVAELAAMPGHPAIKAGAQHKRNFEHWLTGELGKAGVVEAGSLAREVLLLMDGAFAVSLVHRDAEYIEAAGRAARKLVALARGKCAMTANRAQLA
jgi:AcrR family transcriptional regulator